MGFSKDIRIGGAFYINHFRDGQLLHSESFDQIFVNEGLVYALNSAFGVSVGGAPTPIATWYIGLSQANRIWQPTDVAATINTVSNEFDLYDEAARPAWGPIALAVPGSISLTDTGAEGTYTISDLSGVGGSAQIYGAFLISASSKTGSGDATATLAAGSNFPAGARTVLQSDIFKVGYVLNASSGS